MKSSEKEVGQWIPFPTPGQWTEQINGTLPAVRVAQNDQRTALKVSFNYGVGYDGPVVCDNTSIRGLAITECLE